MEDNKEAVKDAHEDAGGGGGGGGDRIAASGEQQTQLVENKKLTDVEVDNLIKPEDGENSVGRRSPNTENLSKVQAETDAEDDKSQDKLNADLRQAVENGHEEEEAEGILVSAQDQNDELNENGAVTETTEVQGNVMEELKNELDTKVSSRSFLLDANDASGDESGTDEEQAAFMKELETFHKERCLDFKPPKFYQEPLNCLKYYFFSNPLLVSLLQLFLLLYCYVEVLRIIE